MSLLVTKFHSSNRIIHLFFIILLLSSCKVYKQDILFQIEDESELSQRIELAEDNYRIQPDDWLQINVFSNGGIQLIDFNSQLGIGNNNNNRNIQNRQVQQYLVQFDGTVKFPIVGKIYLQGLTIDEAESKLEILYDDFFNDSFVKLQFENKRVILLSGNSNQVIPLENQNVSLVEILALSGGVNFGSKANNIKVIRGDLTNPEVYQIDLTTIQGMKNTIIDIEPGDIIYVEPWRRPWRESLKEIAPVVGAVTSLTTLIFLIANLI